jgi:hypothetical protein
MESDRSGRSARVRARAEGMRVLVLAVVAVMGLAFGLGPGAASSTVRALGPLPECRLADIPTVPNGYDDWSTTLVDWLLTVGKDYVPPDLVSVRKAGIAGSGYVRSLVIDDLRAMGEAAAKNGTPIGSWSAYRSYQQQVELFNAYVKAYGYDNAKEFSQRPGHSEHQLGLVIDFMAKGADGMLSGTSATGRWMAANAWKYGWVLSYPPSRTAPEHLWNEAVCFRYEPWHFRYMGRDLAKKIHDSGLTIREYLWANYTTVDVTAGGASPSPSAAASSPVVSPSATATLSEAAASPAATPGPAPAGAVASMGLGAWLLIATLVVAGTVLLAIAWLRVGGRRVRGSRREAAPRSRGR